MKSTRRILIIAVCLMVVFSISISAYAVSETFFSRVIGSHRCTGRGSISGSAADASFTATPLPNHMVQPDECYTSEIWVYVYDGKGRVLGSSYRPGTTKGYVEQKVTGTISNTKCIFTFMEQDLGTYFLYNK